jgi:PAS domain S-box-containing protein
MSVYVVTLALASFSAAICAGFILAASPRQRATQLVAVLAAGAGWWALCEAMWNGATNVEAARLWMRASAPGWCFLGGILPHVMARYLDLYPAASSIARQRQLLGVAGLGYAAGTITLVAAWTGQPVHGPLSKVAWGWTYDPGPVMFFYFAASSPCILFAVICMLRHMRSSTAVIPRPHRISVRLGILLPLVVTPLTDVVLPIAGIPAPRLGSIAYSLFGLVVLGTGLWYGMSFFTPQRFSEEILESLHDGVAMVTPGGVIRRANPAFAALAGLEMDELVGSSLSDLVESPSEQPDQNDTLLTSARGGTVPIALSWTSLHDGRGNDLGRAVVVRDLREIEDMRRRMLIQARLAAVGELVAGLAHEINNPLAFVRSNLALLGQHAKAMNEFETLGPKLRDEIVDESRQLVEESLEGVDRATGIVRGVRRFIQAGSPSRETIDLNDLLKDAVDMLRPRLQPPQVDIAFEPGELSAVRCASQELRQVFLNLLLNAVDAVGREGRVSAATRATAEGVVVEIADDGCGMQKETIERIFDPFFTTKPVGEGTGLGLGISWNIVEAHGGRIEVESERGQGSVFRVHLPSPSPQDDC